MERIKIRAERAIERWLESSRLHLEPPFCQYSREPTHGHISSPIPLRLSRQTERPSRAIAEELLPSLRTSLHEDIEHIEVAGPGFINIFPSPVYWHKLLRYIHDQREDYGRASIGNGEPVQVEFVSANPTGPLTVPHGRQGAVGDVLASILEAVGYRVTREYFINDSGRQITLLGQSLYARYASIFGKEVPIPEDGYHGDYLIPVAEELAERHHDSLLEPSEENLQNITRFAVDFMLRIIKEDLENLGVHFDSWTSQLEIENSGKVDDVLEEFNKRNLTYYKDGALWLKTSRFLDTEDRVLIKSDGAYTYRTPDIAYHKLKYERGFKKIIDIWGPDHHGHIPVMKSAMQALGYDISSLHLIIIQHCTLYRSGEPIKMSTRAGQFITLEEVVREVGRDSARYFFVMRRTDSHLDFDLEVAKAHSLDNPVYYVQYAHARIRSIQRKALEERGFSQVDLASPSADLSRLTAQDYRLVALMDRYPDIILDCAGSLQPNLLTDYLEQVAEAFHAYYTRCPVLSEDSALTKARLYLIEALRVVLRNGLTLLGVSAPDQM